MNWHEWRNLRCTLINILIGMMSFFSLQDIAITKLSESIEKSDIDIRRLRVSGAFHSRHMNEAAQRFNPMIDNIRFNTPKIPIIMNSSGRVTTDPEEIRNNIKDQMTSVVEWRASMITAKAEGVDHFVEISPSRVLTSVVKRIKGMEECRAEFIRF